MREFGLGLLGLIAMTVATQAATPAPAKMPPPSPMAGPCFDVVPNAGAGAPADAILVNRCSGETWVLVRAPVSDEAGDSYTYIWEPLSTGHEQPMLQLTGPRARDD